MRRSIWSPLFGTGILSQHPSRRAVLVPRCLTSQPQVRQRKMPVDGELVSPVSLVSLILKLIDRIKNGRWGRHVGRESWRKPPALRQVRLAQSPPMFVVRHQG